MNLRHARFLRAALIALFVTFGVGCAGNAPMMQPTTVSTADAHGELETSCAGDVCFTYAAE